MYPSAVPYGGEDALVRKFFNRRKGCASEGDEPGVYPSSCVGGEVYNCVAFGSLGAGSSACIGQWED